MLMNLKIPTISKNLTEVTTMEIRVEIGDTLESIVKKYASEAPYRIVLGRVNGVDRNLRYKLRRSVTEMA